MTQQEDKEKGSIDKKLNTLTEQQVYMIIKTNEFRKETSQE